MAAPVNLTSLSMNYNLIFLNVCHIGTHNITVKTVPFIHHSVESTVLEFSQLSKSSPVFAFILYTLKRPWDYFFDSFATLISLFLSATRVLIFTDQVSPTYLPLG